MSQAAACGGQTARRARGVCAQQRTSALMLSRLCFLRVGQCEGLRCREVLLACSLTTLQFSPAGPVQLRNLLLLGTSGSMAA